MNKWQKVITIGRIMVVFKLWNVLETFISNWKVLADLFTIHLFYEQQDTNKFQVHKGKQFDKYCHWD